jgi:hypothetical protein
MDHLSNQTPVIADRDIRPGPRKTVRAFSTLEDLRADMQREREELGRRKLAIRAELARRGLTSIAKIAKRLGYSQSYVFECLSPKHNAQLPDEVWVALGIDLKGLAA